MFKVARDKNKWAYIAETQEYEHLREMLFDEYEQYCKDMPIPSITFEDEMIFFENGNRTVFETKYFTRRRQLSIYCILSLLYPEQSEYLKKLENVICEICNEYSWEVPAHRPCDDINKRDHIDLFAAETAFYLAEIKYILIDRLDALVIDRITKEIKWRVIDSFKREKFCWESLKSNWAAVCGGSVGATLLYEDLETYMQEKIRIENCMQNYLDGLGDDGSCSEGADYWNYGFSYYVMYHELLRQHTRGRLDYFKNDKVERVAGFLNSLYLDNCNVVNFSDATQNSKYYIGTLYFLNKEYGINIPPLSGATLRTDKFSILLRSFLYYDSNIKCGNSHEKIYYDKLGWYIEKKPYCGFAIKGGHNAEEHNHNDIGSFILTYNEKVVFAELGAPEYTGNTFKNKYSNINASSLGHSVPIIDGEQQRAGREYAGKMTVDDTGVTVDMTKAYPTQDKRIIRNCKLTDNEFLLADDFDADVKITERFILLSKPDILNKGIFKVNGLTVSYSDNFTVKCDEIDNVEHDGVTHRTVYILDFETVEKIDRFELKVNLKGENQ